MITLMVIHEDKDQGMEAEFFQWGFETIDKCLKFFRSLDHISCFCIFRESDGVQLACDKVK